MIYLSTSCNEELHQADVALFCGEKQGRLPFLSQLIDISTMVYEQLDHIDVFRS